MARNPPLKPAPKRATAPVSVAPPAKRGRPEHVPSIGSRAKVTAWTGGGIDQEQIAKALSINRRTLAKHYKVELDAGRGTMDGMAITALALAMQRGGKEAVAAAKWWTQSRMGWSEKLTIDDVTALKDTPMRVIIELVGDPAVADTAPSRPRLGFDADNLVQLVG